MPLRNDSSNPYDAYQKSANQKEEKIDNPYDIYGLSQKDP